MDAGWAVAALDLVFPALCPVCDVALGAGRRDPLCGRCWGAIDRLPPPGCDVCGAPSPLRADFARPRAPGVWRACWTCTTSPPAYDYARSAAAYEGPLREALHALKFSGKRAVARPLGDLALEQCRAFLPTGIEALVPVPLAYERERERGFNQAALIADRLARALEIPVIPGWLGRLRATRPQSDLSAAERQANVRGAFRASRRVAGRHVLVVDDVLTTGATLGACARALRDAGAWRIGVLTVARVLHTAV